VDGIVGHWCALLANACRGGDSVTEVDSPKGVTVGTDAAAHILCAPLDNEEACRTIAGLRLQGVTATLKKKQASRVMSLFAGVFKGAPAQHLDSRDIAGGPTILPIFKSLAQALLNLHPLKMANFFLPKECWRGSLSGCSPWLGDSRCSSSRGMTSGTFKI